MVRGHGQVAPSMREPVPHLDFVVQSLILDPLGTKSLRAMWKEGRWFGDSGFWGDVELSACAGGSFSV